MSDQRENPVIDAEKPVGRWSWGRLKGRFLIISILFHVGLALIATYLVVTTLTPRKPPNFKAGPKATANKAVEHKINMVKKQNTMSAPTQTRRITTKGLSKVVLPDMPTVPNANPTTSTMGGVGGAGMAIGGGKAGGTGTGGGGGAPPFGLRDSGQGLPGRFYDFKQTRSGSPTDMVIAGEYNTPKDNAANGIYSALAAKFIDRGMGEGAISRYFVGPMPLYATQIYMPAMNANEAPKAFKLEGRAQPRRWIIVYKGTVMAPESGKYRLVGGADDIIAVRFNGRVVLNNRGKNAKFYPYGGTYQSGAQVGALMDVKSGIPYPIDIVVGEQPGGNFLAYLLIEKEGAEYTRNDKGSPILPIFKFAPGTATRGGGVPEFAPDTSWSIWKAVPRTR